MHSYLGHEGRPPSDFTAIGRAEVRSYGGEILSAQATDVARIEGGRFRVQLSGGSSIVARRVLAATGLVDELPDIDGLAEHWGTDVIHCPFCHGYEVRDKRIVQIISHPMGLHTAGLFRQLTDRLTLVLHAGVDAEDAAVAALGSAGVTILEASAQRIIDDPSGRLAAVELDDGSRVDADAVVIGTRFRVRAEPFSPLGVATVSHPTGLGDVVEVDATGQTSVPGIYAAGNLTEPSHQVMQAAANGSWVAGMMSFGLGQEDIESAARPSANQEDWEQRYSGDQVWSGNPNGTLVNEVHALTPGRALDVGAGEGGDAEWLAQRGWHVTAADIARRAVDRINAMAQDHGMNIDGLHVDANSVDPFPSESFDLVTAHYASIPRTPDHRGVINIVNAVAPGGTLLVVGHDPEPMRIQGTGQSHGSMFDPDAYASVDDFLALVATSSEWQIAHHGKRPRPPGSATASHHADDLVLRAYRRSGELEPERAG